ncbi:uncharacterized protein [Heptranchias perlo]|uniref:uncharacterized protein n=1 Tax=Heptranchias perlo TaxID=212740 RepID=UPI0035593BC8
MGWIGNSLVVALLAVVPFSVESGLIVSMNSRTVEAIVNNDIVLECRVSGYTTKEIDLQHVGVQWFVQELGSPDSSRREVYQFNGGKRTPYRKGATIYDDELKNGIASLFLPSVQFTEEGDYTCVVFIISDNASGKSSMTVSAKPQVTLSSTSITIENGTEKAVRCDSVGFYPILIEMSWIQKTNDEEQIILKHICTGSPVKNEDGTYSISSRMRLRPTLKDSGNVYICHVKHRSLINDLKLETQLTVKEPKVVTPVGIIVGSVFVSVLMCIVILGIGFFTYLKYLRKVPPKVSAINKPVRIVHLQEALLNCQISGYRPENISVRWLLQRKGEKKRNEIYQWTPAPRNFQEPSDVQQTLISKNGLQFDEQDGSFKFELPVVEHNNDGSSSVKCKVMLWPDIYKDDEAILQVEVRHSNLRKHIVRSLVLKIEGIEPKMTDIVIPPRIIHEEVLAVTCPINGFKPRPLAITWYRKQKNKLEEEIVKFEPGKPEFIAGTETEQPKYSHSITELKYEDNTYSVTSVLVFIPTISEDHGTKYICEVVHPATRSKITKDIVLNIKAIPKCDDIKLTPEAPIADEHAFASCRIYSFFPKDIEVIWKKNNIILEETNVDAEVVIGKDDLFYFTSRLKFIPVREDFGKILTCEFQHESITESRKTDRALIPVVSSPLVEYIRSEPQFPEAGKEATIICHAYGFFPKETMFMWFKNDVRTEDTGITSSEPQKDEKTGLFYCGSQWKLFIRPEYHQMEFRVEVLHFPTSHRPSRSSFILHLGGVPIVSDIILEPEIPLYGQRLILKCLVINFSPNEISANWLMDEKPVHSGVTNTGPEKEHGGYYRLCSCLELTPTALDHNKEFAIEVIHSTLSNPVKKQLYLTLPGCPPTVSEIKCNPTRPEKNKVATFTVSLTDYAPQEIEVKWFKGKQPFTGPVANTKPEIAANGLFSSATKIEFAPEPSDQDTVITCEVIHPETKEVMERKINLAF